MNFIKEWGMIAGFAGLALGAFVFLFKGVLQKTFLSKLTQRQSFAVLLTFMLLVCVVSIYSIKIYFDQQQPVNGEVTILVCGEKGKEDRVLTNRGEVSLIYGDAIVTSTINDKGEAYFKQIPETFFEKDAFVEILFSDPLGEPYHSVYPDSSYQLQPNQHITLPVELYGLEMIKGTVRDFETSQLLDSVRISVLGASTYSNEFGEYHLEIPADLQQQFQTIRAMKDGYELYEIADIPVQTNQEFPIILKPKSE